jgi:hypothetical protein
VQIDILTPRGGCDPAPASAELLRPSVANVTTTFRRSTRFARASESASSPPTTVLATTVSPILISSLAQVVNPQDAAQVRAGGGSSAQPGRRKLANATVTRRITGDDSLAGPPACAQSGPTPLMSVLDLRFGKHSARWLGVANAAARTASNDRGVSGWRHLEFGPRQASHTRSQTSRRRTQAGQAQRPESDPRSR